MTTCELRLKAAEIIEQRGHEKGDWGSDEGPCCFLGALFHAATDRSPHDLDFDDDFDEIAAEVGDAVTAAGFSFLKEAAKWNDAPERTQAEVLARLREGCEPVKASAESAS